MSQKRRDKQTRRSRRQRPRTQHIGVQFTPKGMEKMDGLFAELAETEAGREALRLGAGIGAALRPCPTHGRTGCPECGERVGRYTKLHLYGLPADSTTCLYGWDICGDDAEPHLCGIEGDERGHHDGPHVCGECGALGDDRV
jgi:hypothetical protein